MATTPATGRARVVVLAGPSGSGKSRLATRIAQTHGWPIVRLDDFYRDGDDPTLPGSAMGIPDWDNPASWRADDAVAALRALVDTGRCTIPTYDISASRVVGARETVAGPGDSIVAEGIFAAEIIPRLRAEGLLARAYCVGHHRVVTFALRLARDLREHRKPPVILVRRGLVLCSREPEIVARAVACGAVCRRPAEVEKELGLRR
jgi:uridine kinase